MVLVRLQNKIKQKKNSPCKHQHIIRKWVYHSSTQLHSPSDHTFSKPPKNATPLPSTLKKAHTYDSFGQSILILKQQYDCLLFPYFLSANRALDFQIT